MSFTSGREQGREQESEPRWGDVYLSASARGISAMGDFLAATALVLALQSRGAGGMAVAAVLLAGTMPLVLLAPIAGRVADRVDSRLLVVGTGIVQAAACTVLAFTGHPVAIIALVAVLAAGLAVTQPTLGALVPDMVGRDHLPRAMAIGTTATSIGMLAGPALAGLLVGQFGLRVPLLLDAATFLAIVVAGLLIRTRRGRTRRGRTRRDRSRRDGTRRGRSRRTATAREALAVPGVSWRVRDDSLLTTLVVAVTVTVGAISLINVVDVFFVRETLHASETAYGLVGAVWTAAMLVGSWLAARAAKGADDGALARGMLAMLVLQSTVLLASAAVPGIWWLVPLWVLGGVLNGGENVVASVVIARRAPAAARGQAIGTFTGVVNAAIVIGYLLGGALLAVFQPRPLIAAASVAGLVVAAACAAPLLRAARNATAVVPEPAPAEVAS